MRGTRGRIILSIFISGTGSRRKGEGEKGRKGEREKGRKGEREKGRKGRRDEETKRRRANYSNFCFYERTKTNELLF